MSTKIKILRSIFKSIWFNFHYLPVLQAVKLPILLYKPKFLSCKGKIVIDSNTIKTGMIRLGFFEVSVCPNSGITFENYGTLIFKGRCDIGNASTISVNKNAICEIGDNFTATAGLRLVCGHHVLFGRDCLVGWDCTFLDTDFHFLTREDGTTTNKQGSIIIGANNWFGFGCKVLKNTMTNEETTIAANTLLSGNYPPPAALHLHLRAQTHLRKKSSLETIRKCA